MELKLPDTHTYMGGVEPAVFPSADGWIFFSAWCTKGPRNGGEYVFRQRGAGVAEEVEYGPLFIGRGLLTLGGDGLLYISGSDGTKPGYFIVPKYVRFTPNGPMPVPVPVVAPIIDADARRMAQTARDAASSAGSAASGAAKLAQAALTAVQKLPPPLTQADVDGFVWNDHKVQDLVFQELGIADSGLRTLFEKIVNDLIATSQVKAPKVAKK